MPQGQPEQVPEDGLTTRMRRNRPLTIVHTGEMKGKSTAAFGLALRATYGLTEAPTVVAIDPVGSEWVAGGSGQVLPHLLVQNLIAGTSSMGSPGMEDLRWPLPVRPGDTLSAQIEVLETRVSNSRPTMGIVRWRGELRNQHGQLVMSALGTNFFGRKPS